MHEVRSSVQEQPLQMYLVDGAVAHQTGNPRRCSAVLPVREEVGNRALPVLLAMLSY